MSSLLPIKRVLIPADDCEGDSFCEDGATVIEGDDLLSVEAELDGAETTTEGVVTDFEVDFELSRVDAFWDVEFAAGGPELEVTVAFALVPRSRFPPPLPRCGKASWLLVAVTLISLVSL